MNKLTPLRSIRKRCIDCQETRTDVRNCEFDDCALYPLRIGKGRPKLKDIRAYCLWCCLNNVLEVKLCPTKSCPLWIYRLGKNPARKGMGRDKEAMQKMSYSRASNEK